MELDEEELSADEDGLDRPKRQRVLQPSTSHDYLLQLPSSSAYAGPRRLPSLRLSTLHPRPSFFATHARRGLGLPSSSRHISSRPFLLNFSSSDEQVYRCASQRDERSFAPPFALAFSRAAKRGGKAVFAVGCEEGRVSLLDAGMTSHEEAATNRTTFQAHDNAVFDVQWAHDDSVIGTASGDATVRLFDAATQQCTSVLRGHTTTVKSFSFSFENSHLLSTASRDGSIRHWDTRVAGDDGEGSSSAGCVNVIRNAHGGCAGGKKTKSRAAVKSVTSVVHLQHSPHLLASSGSSDSAVRVWDLRKAHSRRVNPAWCDSNDEHVAERVAASGSRPYGVSSLTLSDDGRMLYALSTDSQIHALSSNSLSSPFPHEIKSFSHPFLSCGSFYVRLAVSPCSRYLASGSSDGSIVLFDTHGSGTDGVRLVGGHEQEVSGLDWGRDTLASCSDDLLVRVWDARRGREGRRWAGAE